LNSPLNYRDPDGLLATVESATIYKKSTLGAVAGLYFLGEAVRNSIATCTFSHQNDGPGGAFCFYKCSDGTTVGYISGSFNCDPFIFKNDPRIE
jgi:hypothetical protein